MRQHASKLVLGATLFSSPGLNTGHEFPGVLGVVIALLVLVPPVVLYIRSSSQPGPPNPDGNDDGGGGTGPNPGPRDKPSGGIPLDDATQAHVRLRGKGRLADKRRRAARRPAREPDRTPPREPTPR
jgi:hypothetical protein